MQLHHAKHHQAYVDALNAAVKDHPELHALTLEALLADLEAVPEAIRAAVRNHGGGHANHAFFWSILTPKRGGSPLDELARAIEGAFGDVEAFRAAFKAAALKQFGSGWSFLVVDGATGTLEILSLPNQDTEHGLGKARVLCCDLWEHAYYLNTRTGKPSGWTRSGTWWHGTRWRGASRWLSGDAASGPSAEARRFTISSAAGGTANAPRSPG